MDAMQFIAEHFAMLQRLCKRVARDNGGALTDDLLGDCIDRIPRLLETFDPTKGSALKNYVWASLRMYLRSRVKIRHRIDKSHAVKDDEARRLVSLIAEHDVAELLSSDDEPNAVERVAALMDAAQLTNEQRLILLLHIHQGKTLDEVSKLLGYKDRKVILSRKADALSAMRVAAWLADYKRMERIISSHADE